MTSSATAIVPITLTVNDRTGITLFAPPWEDDDGEQWQGFLGDGAKIVLFPTTAELAAFIASGEEHDLSDHPAWSGISHATPDDLRPATEDRYDLDEVYELAGGEPDPVHVSRLANVVDMVGRIADCCDDGALRSLVTGTPAYAELVDEEVSYQGREGRKRWTELGDTIADSWERAVNRVGDWLAWRGDFSAESDFDEAETTWERVGAEPIAIVLPDATYLTVRGEVATRVDETAPEVAFLGNSDDVVVFGEVAALATYCRTAKSHRLTKLEWWSEVADLEDDADFEPDDDARFDLRKPSADGASLLYELVDFCDLDADLSVLDVDDVAALNRQDWDDVVAEVRTCFIAEG